MYKRRVAILAGIPFAISERPTLLEFSANLYFLFFHDEFRFLKMGQRKWTEAEEAFEKNDLNSEAALKLVHTDNVATLDLLLINPRAEEAAPAGFKTAC